jgi:alkylation response protein AidB-like acyl-CoA dehydrogenase
MELALSDIQIQIQSSAKKFAEVELTPVAAMLDNGQGREVYLANLRKLAELGFMGLNVDAEYGGTEAGVVAFSIAMTEIAKSCAATAVAMSVTNLVSEVIQSIGTEEQKLRYIPRLCGGEYAGGSFCLSESGAGSDPSGMQTRAVLDDDEWVINGTKMWISSAEHAGIFVVWAVSDSSVPKGKGITCFLVERDNPGVTIGKAEHKMGQRGSSTNPVIFDNCRVPASSILGDPNDGFRIAITELAGGRIGIGSLALGVATAAMDIARAYISEREQFGKKISDFQGIQWSLADTYTELEAGRLLLMNAAYLKETEQPFMKQAAMAKLYTTEAANRACYNALQLMGGAGYTEEYPLERFARDVRVTTIYEGTSEIQRVIIGRELLREIA